MVKTSYNFLIVWGVVASLLFSLGGCKKLSEIFFEAKSDEETVNAGQPAPDFTLFDITGKEHRLSQYLGKYVILEWVNFDCPYVKKHYKSGNMQNLQKKYTAQGEVWLSINSSAPGKQGNFTIEEINKRSKKLATHYSAYLLDPDGKVGRMYGAQTTPHMYIIDPKGKLIYQGAIDSIPTADEEDIPEATNYITLAVDESQNGKALTHRTTVAYGCAVKY